MCILIKHQVYLKMLTTINKLIRFGSGLFDKETKQFTIFNGTTGEYDYREVVKCSVLNEDAKFRGKDKPFQHQVLGGTIFMFGLRLQ